jgi:ferredoxin
VSRSVLVTVVDPTAGFSASFDVISGETVLTAALRAEIDIPYSCRSGTCRTCISRIVSGHVEHDPDFADELFIDDDEVAAGYRLLCSSLAYADSVIDIG